MQILLVEDDDSLVRVLVPALESYKYSVEVSRNGKRGKEMACQSIYNLILLDIELPDLDGISVCSQLRQSGNFIPIILLTARHSDTDKLLGLEAGADDYIVKPFNLEVLMARIDALLRREHHFFNFCEVSLTPDDQFLAEQLRQIWDRTKDITFSRIDDLFDVLQSLEKGELNDTLRERTQRTSHKLAGSLGTFGFDEGSKIARALEQAFNSCKDVEGCLEQVRPLILELHQVVIATDHKLHGQTLKTAIDEPVSLLPIPLPSLDLSGVSSPPFPTDRFHAETESVPISKFPTQPIVTKDYILLADPDEEFCQVLVHDAVSWKLGIKMVSSARQFMAIVQESFPAVLLLNLNVINSLQDWQKFVTLRSQYLQHISLVILSEAEQLENRLRALELNADIVLQKPVTSSQVFASISRAMNFHEHNRVKVMVVDDDPQVTQLLQGLLKSTDFQVEVFNESTEFWHGLNRFQPDLLVLDVEMPALDGLRLCQMIRQDFQWSWLPILFLTGHDDIHTLQEAFAAGADDFISKPIDPNGFVNRVLNRWQRSQLYRNQMDTDLLTGISNRTGGSRSFSHLLQVAAQSQKPLCLAVLDLDHFKQVNDRYGHEEGDRVLREFGEFLKQNCRGGDVLARWGGEEFLIAMIGLTKEAGVKRMNEIRHEWRLKEFISVKGDVFRVSFSGGVAQYPSDGSEFQILYRTADAALYKAKAAGRDLVLPAL